MKKTALQFFLFLFVVTIAASCSSSAEKDSKLKGFEYGGNGVYYKVNHRGNNNRLARFRLGDRQNGLQAEGYRFVFEQRQWRLAHFRHDAPPV